MSAWEHAATREGRRSRAGLILSPRRAANGGTVGGVTGPHAAPAAGEASQHMATELPAATADDTVAADDTTGR